ncbi:MAG: MtrB/PioB family outer membrane beta-barrel protein [Sideroxyarcus sp.]
MTQSKHFEKVESIRDRRFFMNNSPRMKLLTLCIGAALAQMAGIPALADTAIGVDTVNGNAANPGYLAGPIQLDTDWAAVKRSPSGQMYAVPRADVEESGKLSGRVDVGYQHESDTKSYAKRKEYSDQRNGLYLNNFKLSGETDKLNYFILNGGGVGRKDQFYDVTTGKYGDWKVRAFYNETLHVFTDTWKSLYSGEGTGNLTTGLSMPTMVTTGAYTQGTAGYAGATATCTVAAPCWQYNGTVYGNAVALLAIRGTTGTPNSVTGAIPVGILGTAVGVGVNGATNLAQSNMAAAIAAKLAATDYSELSLVRKKGGVRGDINLTDSLKGYASYTLENRVGARPFAMNDGNISTEIAEPIDYKTHDLMLGLTYHGELTQANVRLSSSMFRNNIDTLNVQYALLGAITPQGAIQHATFDLAPNNDAYNLKGEFAHSMPELWKARFTAAASWGSNRQDDTLLAPISAAQSADLANAGVTTLIGANVGYAANTMLVSNWNTTDALSQKTAKQRIDNKLVDLGLSMSPVNDLNVKASYRFYETDNKGGYTAYNPLTGQFGRGPSTGNGTGAADLVIAPGGGGTCYTLPGYPAVPGCSSATLANGANVAVYGQPRSTRQYNYGVAADYDLNRTSSLNAAVEREDFHRDFRERAKTWENKIKLGYVNRALGVTTLRVSLENDTKRGSEYRYRTFEDLGTGLPGLDPATQVANSGLLVNGSTYPAVAVNLFNRYSYFFRKYDQADRNQKILNTRLNVMAREDLDVGVVFQVKRADYPNSFYGLTKDNQDSLGLDFNFQASTDRIITAFYNFQNGKKSMAMNSGNAAVGLPASPCTVANIALYGYSVCSDTLNGAQGARPYSSIWTSDTTDRNDVLGLGLQEDLGFMHIGIDYTYARSSTHIAYNFGATAITAGGNNANAAAIAGSALPDMTTVQNTITLHLLKQLDKKTSIRAIYRHDGMKIKDWHYDGVIANVMAAYDANTLLLDTGPMNYHVNTFGVFLNYKM